MDVKVQRLKELIAKSDNIVFFGGAGVSTESGIPDFRSKDGLYNQKYKYPPETILSHEFFVEKPEEFYEFYKEKMNILGFEPNITHFALTKLEEVGKLKCIITQNIDGLHQKAGSKNVAELHGSVLRNYCIRCRKKYEANIIFDAKSVPKCECGGTIRPDVVLYSESLGNLDLNKAYSAIEEADLLIVGGTSLTVAPACYMIHSFTGKNLVIINKDVTDFDNIADLVINAGLGEVFGEIIKEYE